MSDQLSDDELKHLRDLMIADKRRQWLVTIIKSAAVWITAVSAGYLAFKNVLSELIGKVP